MAMPGISHYVRDTFIFLILGCRENRTLVHCWQEYKLIQILWKKAWRCLKKLKTERKTLCPSNPTFKCISKVTEIRISKSYLHFHVHCNTIHNRQGVETSKCSLTIWSSLKQEDNPSICNNMDRLGGHYIMWNMSDPEGQALHDFTYMRKLKIVKP